MTFLWALIPSPIKRGLAWAVAGLVLVLGVFRAGKRDERQEAKKASLEATVKAMKDRERIDDGIDQDIDLAGRARRAGVVRDPKR